MQILPDIFVGQTIAGVDNFRYSDVVQPALSWVVAAIPFGTYVVALSPSADRKQRVAIDRPRRYLMSQEA